MNLKEKNLARVLSSKYIPADQLPARYRMHKLLNSDLRPVIEDVYADLGGKGRLDEITIPGYPLEFGKFCVELDDQLQFNRYRGATLKSPLYDKILHFPLQKYRIYCRKFERECLKSGMKLHTWTNQEAEQHFGKAQEAGDLGLNGASGWKMTAFISFLKDALAIKMKIKLIRLSIWDEMMIDKKLVKVKDLLLNPSHNDSQMVIQFFERKLINSYI